MSRSFKLWEDPYGCGIEMYQKRSVTINPGVTVLVGCNGIGKSTMLHCIKEHLQKDKIPYLFYDNLNEGGSNSAAEAGFMGDYSFLTTSITSSEGENIMMNMSNLAERMGVLVRTGKDHKYNNPFVSIFSSNDDEKITELSNERWILLDAVDSGFSVDNIVELKERLFKTILNNNFGKEIYIIVSANEYEMANGEQCFDVYNGKYITFRDYEEYRELILKSREEKNKRDFI